MRLRFLLIAAAIMLVGYGVLWHVQSGAVVAHVERSLNHLRQEFKKTNPNARIQWDEIQRAGFPFAPSARITAPTLSMVYRDESYAVGFDALTFAPGGVGGIQRDGVYVALPPSQDMRALFAKPNSAPEEYRIGWDAPITMKMLAYKPGVTPKRCIPGQPCDSLPEASFPLSHIRVTLPTSVILLTRLGSDTKPIQFRFNDMQRAAAGLDMPIPADITRPLELFVGMLREAHIYQ